MVREKETIGSTPIRHWPLRRQLGVALTLATCLVSVLTGELVRHFERRYLENDLIQQTERVFSTLSGAAIDTVIARDRSALKNIVQGTVIHDRDIVLLTLTDSEGEVLVEWGRAHGPDEIRSFSKDLTYQGKRTGTMMMQWDISQRLQPIHSHVGNMRLLVFVSLLILSLVIVALLDRFILQPMKTLNLRLSGPDGQDRGSSRFTALEIVKLHEALSSLKRRVEERTRELRLEVVERKTAETVAQQARLNAEAANQAKSEFLATMSHEIRTPMNAIMGFASILVETPLDAEQLDFVQTIKGSGESLLALLNDVLDFSNIESGHLELENVPFDLPQLTEEVASLLSSRAEDRQIEVATHCDPRLPRHWLGDPIRVRQVLLNLVGNAIKFTDQGHVFIEVTLEHDFHGVPGEIALLKVQDTGIGIAADKQHLLFQKFQQVDSSTTRRFGGTGLGLAISRLLTDLMGGTIGVESELGRGTTFWFTLPITVCGLTPPPPPLGPSIELQRARILVVDDREINRIVLRRQLAEWGLHHECATTGSEALAKLRTSAAFGEPFDIALLDSSLPDRDTMTLAQEIRRDAALHTTGLVFLASASQRTETSIFLSRGFAATLVKPLVRQSALLEVLRKGREQRRKLQADPPTLSSPGGLPNLAQKPRSSFGLPSPDPSPVAQGTDRSLKTQPAARILLVEDNPAGQKLARILLENLGCQVTVATNGRDAVNRALVEAFDLVFMDCEMLECDGFEATHELRRLEKQGTLPRLREGRLPIVALTANAVSGNRTRCLEAGMDDYITKPVSGEDLRQSIHTWVRPTERKTY